MPATTYTFFPWLRRGVANLIQAGAEASASSIRATLTATLTVASEARQADTPPLTLKLIGPADITGIESRQVIRTEPRDGVSDFEPNYLAAIDFYDEDFPWRFSPTAPDNSTHRLCPWLVLVLLKDGEFTRDAGPGGPSPSFTLSESARRPDLFPVVGQEWAWAHVHLNQKLGGATTNPDLVQLQTILDANPDLAYSRLLCPRELEPNCTYTALLLPTFEVGRKAGLGEAVAETDNGTTRSWEGPVNQFPIYYEWSFRTGVGGDFETLVRNMVPRDMDPAVGVRNLDIGDPGFDVSGVVNPPDTSVGLEGALLAPTTVRRGLANGSNFVPKVEPILNAPADTRAQGNADPVVAPPIYGCWHAHVEKVNTPASDAQWVNDLNLDPRYRATAGLGVRVIRAHQDEYLRSAWSQIGDVLTVNRKIRRAQLAVKAASAAYTKSLMPLAPERALSLLAPTLGKIRGGPITLASMVRASVTPRAALSPALAKLLRPRGRIGRALFPAEARASSVAVLVGGLSQGRLSAAPPRPAAGGATIESINQAILQPAASTPQGQAVAPGPTPAQLAEVVKLLSAPALNAVAIAALPAQSDFQFTGSPADNRLPAIARPVTIQIEPGDTPAAADMRRALADFNDLLSIHVAPTPPRPPLDLGNLHTQALAATEPQAAFVTRFSRLFRMGTTDVLTYVQSRYSPGFATTQTLPEVMAYPDIKDPMSRPLVDLSSEYLLPNLKLIPNNTISLLKPNQLFIESYLVGLNHEFARELLWNEYPTDQQGSYFRQFWDVSSYVDTAGRDPQTLAEALKDIPPIHRWETTSVLGSHNQRDPQGNGNQSVLVLRGDLLKRYPNTFIYAQKAAWGTGTQINNLVLTDPTGQLFETSPQDPRLRFPLYKATVPPDIYLIGFDLTLDQIRGDPRLEETATARAVCGDNLGWFFVLQQAVGEPRFGLDTEPATAPSPVVWDNLAWANLAVAPGGIVDVSKPFVTAPGGTDALGLTWGSNAADMASILYQEPVMVAIHGSTMLKNLSPAS
jgi:hypothetical protein